MHRLFGSRGLAIAAVSLIALVGGALLAWWQWTRYQSASGTLQNLGYVLQWPLFGVFPAFMFWRINRTARREAAADREIAGAADVPVLPTYVQNRTTTYDDGGDRELLAYNQRLAQLADRPPADRQADQERRHAG